MTPCLDDRVVLICEATLVASSLALLEARPVGHLPPLLRAEPMLVRAYLSEEANAAEPGIASAVAAMSRAPTTWRMDCVTNAELLNRLENERRQRTGGRAPGHRQAATRPSRCWIGRIGLSSLSMALRNKPDASALNCEYSGSGLGYSRPNCVEVASSRDKR